MKKYFKLIFIALFAQTFTACVGGGGVLTEESAPVIAQNIMSFINSADFPKGDTKQNEVPSEIASYLPSPLVRASGCVTESGSVADGPDNDGILLEKTVSMNCSNDLDGTYMYTTKGSYTIKDLDDTVPDVKGGYEYIYDIKEWKFEDIANDFKHWGSYIGKWTASGTDDVSNYKGYSTGTFGSVMTHYGPRLEFEYEFIYDYEISYVKLGGTRSAMFGKGTHEINGTFMTDPHSGPKEVIEGSAKMTWEAVNLVYDSTCASVYYRSGEYKFTDVGGNIMSIRYSCSKYEIYLNSKLIFDSANP